MSNCVFWTNPIRNNTLSPRKSSGILYFILSSDCRSIENKSIFKHVLTIGDKLKYKFSTQ